MDSGLNSNLQYTWAPPLFPSLCNEMIRTMCTNHLGNVGFVHKDSYPSEPLLLLACVASLWYAWVGEDLCGPDFSNTSSFHSVST